MRWWEQLVLSVIANEFSEIICHPTTVATGFGFLCPFFARLYYRHQRSVLSWNVGPKTLKTKVDVCGNWACAGKLVCHFQISKQSLLSKNPCCRSSKQKLEQPAFPPLIPFPPKTVFWSKVASSAVMLFQLDCSFFITKCFSDLSFQKKTAVLSQSELRVGSVSWQWHRALEIPCAMTKWFIRRCHSY